MNDKELKLNASGYYDEPCYKAITAAPKPGEIWENGNTGKLVLVLANTNAICSILNLIEQDKENRIKVTARVPMYTAPYMVCYCFESNLTGFVKRVKDDEWTDVRLAVARALGLEDKPLNILAAAPNEIVEEMQKNIYALEKKCDILHNERCAFEEKAKALEEQRNKLLEEIAGYGETIKKQSFELREKEKRITTIGDTLGNVCREADRAEIYKEMYMTLLDKVISARGGSVNE